MKYKKAENGHSTKYSYFYSEQTNKKKKKKIEIKKEMKQTQNDVG